MKNLPVNPLERQIARRTHVASDDIYVHAYDADRSEDSLKIYLDILKRRKWSVIIPFLIFTSLSTFMVIIAKPVYQSTARVLIENDTPQVLKNQEFFEERDRFSSNPYLTEYMLIKNRENIEETVDILNLDKKPPEKKFPLLALIDNILKFLKTNIKTLKEYIVNLIVPKTEIQAVIDPAQRYRMEVIAGLSAATTVVPIEGTSLADITISGSDPYEVAQQVNTLVEIYLRRNFEKKLEMSRQAITWLTKKTAELKDKTQAAELALQNFRETKNLVSFDLAGRRSTTQERLAELHAAHAQANTARVDFQSRLNKVKSLSADKLENIEAFPTIAASPLIGALRKTYLDLQAQYSNAAGTFQPKHPKMVQLQSDIATAKQALNEELRKIVSAMQAEYSVLQAKEDTLARELNVQKDGTLRLSSDMITYDALHNEVESQRGLYLEAAKRLEEMKLAQALITNNVKIVEPAAVPLAPVASKKTVLLFLSVVLGGAFGTGLAFVKEYFDDRFKDADEIEQNLRTPFLGLIPSYTVDRRRGALPIILGHPRSLAAEAYRFLRTRLSAYAPTVKTLLLTSAVPAEGKSTTTVNLGMAFAQLGLKVLLVDADLRRPALHRYLHLPRDRGLTTVLEHTEDWQGVLQDTVLPTLKALLAGPTPHNPSDVLSRKALQQLFEQAKAVFDLVLVDTALTLSVPDVEILAPLVDGVLLVHTPGQCDRRSVFEAKGRLERVGANILGIVFNNVKAEHQKYYYHSYSYNYNINMPLYYESHEPRSVEPYHPHQEFASTSQRHTKTNDQNIDILIHDFKLEKTINDQQSDDRFIFLILDLEIVNKLDTPYIFTPQKTTLYVDKPDKYGVILSSIYQDIEQQETHIDGSYTYSNMTQIFENGLVDEKIIHPHASIRGIIIFHIPENIHNFVLSHNNEYINISISPIRNS